MSKMKTVVTKLRSLSDKNIRDIWKFLMVTRIIVVGALFGTSICGLFGTIYLYGWISDTKLFLTVSVLSALLTLSHMRTFIMIKSHNSHLE